jgi:uncharacterized membrane protein YgcG
MEGVMEKSQSAIKPAEERTEDSGRHFSGIAFPTYALTDSIEVANAIHNKGGGYATREQLAAFLEYRSTSNGAFLSRVGAAKLFGLLTEENKTIRISPLATRILMPESEEQKRTAMIEAFFRVPLFKALYEEYRGKDLPEGLGLRNALRVKFQVVPKRIDFAYRTFFDSAETAGFFQARGNKSQLILPVIRGSSRAEMPSRNELHDGGGSDGNGAGSGGGHSGGDGRDNPPQAKSKDDLQNAYIGTLIEALREKSKAGEMDQDLMGRIERLLELKG